ncbi:hypothetical protein HZA42_06055 [Candidatus Peregrinibacteria bacterium]|nr:hypothetical protein [Candidatus Peregrinibacteria bacterium]
MIQPPIPPEIRDVLAGEPFDFIVKSSRAVPLKKSLYVLVFGLFWLAFMSIFVAAFFGPVFMGKEVRFELNGAPTVAGPGNLDPLLIPALIIGSFVLIGLGLTGYGIYLLRAKGAWYIGTPKRLVIYKKNETRSIDWEQFSGDIEVNGTAEKGSITLLMRTGQMVSQRSGLSRYVSDTIYIAGIQNAFQIEKILVKRIKENDPTPPGEPGI